MEESDSKHPGNTVGVTSTPVITPPGSTTKKRKNDSDGDQDPSPKRSLYHSTAACGEIFETNVEEENDLCDHRPNNTPFSQRLTQPVDYSQDSTAGIETGISGELATLEDVYCSSDAKFKSVTESVFKIGRSSDSDLVSNSESVSRQHCVLRISQEACLLIPTKPCWVERYGRWDLVDKKPVLVGNKDRFRLIKPGDAQAARQPGIEYRVYLRDVSDPPRAGSHSADVQYQKLLRFILEKGVLQTGNKKGANVTLPEAFNMNIDLSDLEDRYLLPFTTLRYIGQLIALMECLWYVQGEDHVGYLQNNNCRIWDKQVQYKDGKSNWIGHNYGLLAHFPQDNGKPPINQLEDNVIKVLGNKSKCSRNMVCHLGKPGEETTQDSCTSNIQFTVTPSSIHPGEMALDLTVNQRSSDVVVGLPHDLVVWSSLLHLVRREVLLRYNRKLYAGKLTFSIASGGAHYYTQNKKEFEELLRREPKTECQPYLVIDNLTEGMFDLAKKERFDPNTFIVHGYKKEDVHPRMKPEQAV